MANLKVVEVLDKYLASFLELAKKWLIDWRVDVEKLLHFLHQFRKEDFFGLLNGTHEVKAKPVSSEKRGNSASELFEEGNTVNIFQNPVLFWVNQENVMKFLEPVLRREAQMGNIDPKIDSNIWRYFDGKMSPGSLKDFKIRIYWFLSKINDMQILEEAEKTGVKQVSFFFEALSILKQSILAGEVDRKKTGIIVYFYFDFEVNYQKVLYRFHACRCENGQLRLLVHKLAFLDGEYNEDNASVGACFKI